MLCQCLPRPQRWSSSTNYAEDVDQIYDVTVSPSSPQSVGIVLLWNFLAILWCVKSFLFCVWDASVFLPACVGGRGGLVKCSWSQEPHIGFKPCLHLLQNQYFGQT